jgi:hypothetical protein
MSPSFTETNCAKTQLVLKNPAFQEGSQVIEEIVVTAHDQR